MTPGAMSRLLRQHPDQFLVVGRDPCLVTLTKFAHLPEVQQAFDNLPMSTSKVEYQLRKGHLSKGDPAANGVPNGNNPAQVLELMGGIAAAPQQPKEWFEEDDDHCPHTPDEFEEARERARRRTMSSPGQLDHDRPTGLIVSQV